ncbi:General transcription factor 2-related zinc finger protein [Zea mays]|uniref:General transcription factor 2-related zinc finger protein n=1 Tax=Zea mays TaxID=4577 RepID=A0A1D6JCY3_MAIZE|nr:General transcription factor 2-related zinc finger protein [Zea mays]
MKRKFKTIDCFFQRDNPRATPIENPNLTNVQDSDPINLHTEAAELNQQETLATAFERDPGGLKPIGKYGSDTFTFKGFNNWKKVNEGKECAFLKHMGNSGSAHNYSVGCFNNLKNSMTHIDKVMVKENEKLVAEARLRLTTTINSIRWLTFQGCPFRGHDESQNSLNQGNFLEMVKLLASYNKEVKGVVLQNAPKNAKYTSSDVQKEILSIVARKVQKLIREEIGTSKFCIMVDEARDESKKEQMAIVIRFVNKEGLIKERFLDLVHVHNFFQHATFIINVVSSSTKRNDELLAAQAEEIAREIELGELDTGQGANQMSSLQRPGDTRWSSHYKSIQSLKKMFSATISVLRSIANDRSVSKYSRGDAAGALQIIVKFDFVFILLMMEKIMKITDVLCQTLQKKSIDILNALDSVSNTKVLLGNLRNDGWDPLLQEVNYFCEKNDIDILDLNHKYVSFG